MTQGERVKQIRKSLNLTLEKFGARIGVGKTTISNLENNRRTLTEHMLKSICREFNVNAGWLCGESAEMFNTASTAEALARLAETYLPAESEAFKQRLITVLAGLTEDQWAVLAELAGKLADKKAGQSTGALTYVLP